MFLTKTQSKISNRNILRRWMSIIQLDFHLPYGSYKSYLFIGRQ